MTRFALPVLTLLAAAPAVAAGFQNLDALETRLTVALGAGIGEPGGPAVPLDRRLKLASCPQTIAIDPPALGAVALRCAPLGWRIRVPLARLAAAQSAGVVLASIAPVIRRGDPIDLVAEQPGFSVSVGGIAQEDGAPGARIRVRTAGDGRAADRTVFAEVVEAGRARLPGFK